MVAKSDVVYLLRLQNERMNEQFLPTLREYTATYGLTAERARLLGPSALVMHPGPVRRGIEIAAEVVDSPASVITAQVANGVAVRMAVLYLLLGSGAPLARERQVLLRGGTVVDSTGSRRADVLVKGEVVVAVEPDLGARRPAPSYSTLAGAWWPQGWSTCTRISGNRVPRNPRRSRPDPGRPPSAVIRLWWPCRTPSRRRTRLPWYASSSTSPRVLAATSARPGPSRSAARVRCCLRWPKWRLLASGFSPTMGRVESAALMRRALEYASGLGVVVADHCEDASLAGEGCMNEGDLSSLLGLPGRPAVAEEIMVRRDLALARLHGARLHVLHLSCAESAFSSPGGQGGRGRRQR